MMERGFTFKPNVAEIVVIKGDVEDPIKKKKEKN